MVTDPAIGTRIRLRRQELHLTQEEFARRVGVHPSSVLSWEKGRHFPARYQGAVEAELGISLRGEKHRRLTRRSRRDLREDLSPEDFARVMELLGEPLDD